MRKPSLPPGPQRGQREEVRRGVEGRETERSRARKREDDRKEQRDNGGWWNERNLYANEAGVKDMRRERRRWDSREIWRQRGGEESRDLWQVVME